MLLALTIVVLYIVAGLITVFLLAFFEDFFNYWPERDMISPGTLKYLLILFWPVVAIPAAIEGICNLVSCLNRKFNKMLNVRS